MGELVRIYRKDDLDGLVIDRDVLDNYKANGYTEDEQEAIAASTEPGGSNYTGTATDTEEGTNSAYTSQQVQVLMPFLTKLNPIEGQKLIDAYVQGFIETGQDSFALAQMRNCESYAKVFPGITRDDGSLRMTEANYLQNKEAVLIHFNEFGIGGYGAQVIDNLFPSLVENNVSPDEIASRLAVTDRQLGNLSAEQKRNILSTYEDFYSTELGEAIQLEDASLIPLVIDPEINASVLNRQLNVAKIGNQYAVAAGAQASRTAIETLVGAGLQASEAQRTFQAAVDRALITSRVARSQNRAASPTALELVETQLLGDDDTRTLLRNIEAQAASESTVATGARRAQSGAVIGLTEE